MKALINDDLIIGTTAGDVPGVAIPEPLAGLPLDRLRVVNGSIVDAGGKTDWFIDDLGRKRMSDGPGRWALVCAWDAPLIREGAGWRVAVERDALAPKIKAECRRRILAVVNETAQINLAAAAAGDDLSASDLATYRAGLAWIQAMRTKCRDLVVAVDSSFANDAHWPEPSAAIINLAKQF